eukprot:19262-Chlamydomonas_euryale.AAC.2
MYGFRRWERVCYTACLNSPCSTPCKLEATLSMSDAIHSTSAVQSSLRGVPRRAFGSAATTSGGSAPAGRPPSVAVAVAAEPHATSHTRVPNVTVARASSLAQGLPSSCGSGPGLTPK